MHERWFGTVNVRPARIRPRLLQAVRPPLRSPARPCFRDCDLRACVFRNGRDDGRYVYKLGYPLVDGAYELVLSGLKLMARWRS